jgi:hypothetical protein
MQLIYYHWTSQKIVYYFEKDAFDIEFAIPGTRAAYFSSTSNFSEDITDFNWNWAVNKIVKDSTPIDNELFSQLELYRFQCACVHDVIRLCNAAKARLLHDSIHFFCPDDDFVKQNIQNIEHQFNRYVSLYVPKLVSTKSIDETRLIYRDFWVATKYIDDLVDIKINKFI